MKKILLTLLVSAMLIGIQKTQAQTPQLTSPNWKMGLVELVKSKPSPEQIDNYFVQYKVSTPMALTQLSIIGSDVAIVCNVGCIVSYVICADLCGTAHSCAWCEVEYNRCQKSCEGVSLKKIVPISVAVK